MNDHNFVYARFDIYDFNEHCENVLSIARNTDAERICITHNDVKSSLKRIRCGKAGGPDNIASKLSKSCAEQLVAPLSTHFQASLDQSSVPDAWKLSQIIPVSKKSHPKELNHLRPTALTSIIMKCL